jgi:hypothetical protein
MERDCEPLQPTTSKNAMVIMPLAKVKYLHIFLFQDEKSFLFLIILHSKKKKKLKETTHFFLIQFRALQSEDAISKAQGRG